MTIYDFLVAHADKHYPPAAWAELIGVRIIDNDGWKGRDYACPISLGEFLARMKASTVEPVRPYEDEEVIGLDENGCVILWNAVDGQPYNSGETPEQFGLENLTPQEKVRIQANKS